MGMGTDVEEAATSALSALASVSASALAAEQANAGTSSELGRAEFRRPGNASGQQHRNYRRHSQSFSRSRSSSPAGVNKRGRSPKPVDDTKRGRRSDPDKKESEVVPDRSRNGYSKHDQDTSYKGGDRRRHPERQDDSRRDMDKYAATRGLDKAGDSDRSRRTRDRDSDRGRVRGRERGDRGGDKERYAHSHRERDRETGRDKPRSNGGKDEADSDRKNWNRRDRDRSRGRSRDGYRDKEDHRSRERGRGKDEYRYMERERERSSNNHGYRNDRKERDNVRYNKDEQASPSDVGTAVGPDGVRKVDATSNFPLEREVISNLHNGCDEKNLNDDKCENKSSEHIDNADQGNSSQTTGDIKANVEAVDNSENKESGLDEEAPKNSKWGGPGTEPCAELEVENDLSSAKLAAMKAAQMVNQNFGVAGVMTADAKKKLLWAGKRAAIEQVPVAANNHWDAVHFTDQERQEKFNKLMGMKSKPGKGDASQCTQDKQRELQEDLEKQFTAGLRRRDGRTVGLGL